MAKTDYHIFVENGKVGLKDATDRVVLFAVYDGIVFTDTDTPICVCKDGKWGLTDIQGWTITDAKYEYMSIPCNGSMAVRINDKWGFIDYKGQEIVPPIYDFAEGFIDAEYCFGTSCALVQKEGKWGTINTKGEVVIPFEYDWARGCKGRIVVEKGDKYGIINHKNEFIIPFVDDELCFIDDDIIEISHESKHGAMNLATKKKYEFDFGVEEFYGDYTIAFKKNGGGDNIVDKEFNLLLPEWHEDMEMLENGKAVVIDQKECFLYDCASGKSEECQQDDNFVYFPDGKTVFGKSLSENLCIKPGIENMAYLAYCSVNYNITRYQRKYKLETLEFMEGVTTIGTGWEEICSAESTYTPQVDIYLPSTLKTVNAEAFSRMITMIRNVYVPNGMVETMKSVLPSYLRPYVKERPKSGFINFLKNLFK